MSLYGCAVVTLYCAVCAGARAGPLTPAPPRRELSLDGVWDIAEGSGEALPSQFTHRAPVPGLCDMAEPPFKRVGFKGPKGRCFFYRRTFEVPGQLPPCAYLRVGKAKYGLRAYLNGALVGEGYSCFTAHTFSVRKYLRAGKNEVVLQVGAFRDAVPPEVPAGWDFEKYRYIPGVYDSVSLILTGTPTVANVQVAPRLSERKAEVTVFLRHVEPGARAAVSLSLRRRGEEKVLSHATLSARADAGGNARGRTSLSVPDCVLWSPENPALYELDVSTGGDRVQVRFGMRSFRCDPKTGRAFLNGRMYFLRGTNVCCYRFFEDERRGDKPWRHQWVEKLHKTFKSMHWNAIRYCIGFPPEIWYEVADELGFLIQDEYPLWYLGHRNWPSAITADSLAREYRAWMEERWNHPCVVLWDAQNESVTGGVTAEAIKRVRRLDRSDRPWDNGWDRPIAPTDCIETHPYLFIRNWTGRRGFRLSDLRKTSPRPPVRRSQRGLPNALLINEYGWLWLTRDGNPTCLTGKVYRDLLGEGATPGQRRRLYARYLAALTEFWRCGRKCAGVLHFCGLTYSRPGDKPRPVGGATSDHFLDLETLELEPLFFRYVRDAFSPVGLMLDFFEEEVDPRTHRELTVVVINDTERPWEGRVSLAVRRGKTEVARAAKQLEVPALGKRDVTLPVVFPRSPGSLELVAELRNHQGRPVRSRREVKVRVRD